MLISKKNTALIVGFAILMLSVENLSVFAQQKSAITYQGRLTEKVGNLSASYDIQFSLYEAESGGSPIATLTKSAVLLRNGYFSVELDFDTKVFDGPGKWLEVIVKLGGGVSITLSPRQKLTASPYAIRSQLADQLSSVCTGCVTDSQVSSINASKVTGTVASATIATTATSAATFTGTLSGDVSGQQSATSVNRIKGTEVSSTPPTNGQVLKFDAATNRYVPAADNTSDGTITGVTAGVGLTGGGTSGGVTLSIADNGITTTKLQNASVTNEKIESVSATKVTGTVTSAATATTATSATTFTGTLSGDVSGQQGATSVNRIRGTEVSSTAPTNGQVLKFDAATNRYTPSADNSSTGTITGVTAGAGLTGGGTSGGVTLSIADNGITTAKLQNASVTNDKIANISADKVTGTVASATNAANANYATSAGTAITATESFTGTLDRIRLRSTSREGCLQLATNAPQATALNFGLYEANCNVLPSHITFYFGSPGLTFPQRIDLVTDGWISAKAGATFAGDVRVNCANLKNLNGNNLFSTSQCNYSSDERLKRDISPFSSVLDRLVKLQPVTHYWRSSEYPSYNFGEEQAYGLIAQEVEKIFPEMVSADKQGFKNVDYPKLPILLLQATKDLKAENDRLRNEIEELKHTIQVLKSSTKSLTDQENLLSQIRAAVCRLDSAPSFCKELK